MKISHNWLKDYIELDLAIEEISEILTDIGLEVEGLEKTQSIEGGLAGLVIGEVKTAEKHPNADRLKVTTVDVGEEELRQIVCGAPNVAAGQKVIVALPGTTLYPLGGDSFTIKEGKIRGEASLGMICAEDEIGIGQDHDGIIELDSAARVGAAATTVIPVETDYIIEIGLTPNRSDATNHIGVAKDLKAALKFNKGFTGEVKMPDVSKFKVDHKKLPIAVEVQDTKACPRYAGVSIANVTVKESPEWLKTKLKALGLNPINNIVDITNFVLHELGQPLHAFDLDQITGKKIVVKKEKANTKFITLDEQERKLHQEDLMICNTKEGMCIAGVFGGIKSGVTDATKNIFLESACFDAVTIRKTSTRHTLRTDAATRFEKGVDPNGCVYALKRAALLIKELAGGEIASDIVDVYPNKVEKPEIMVRFSQVNRLAGIPIASKNIENILEAMEMEIVKQTAESITIKVPTNKVDVLREVDVIEEILRIYGYNNIPIGETVISTLSYQNQSDKNASIRKQIADYLAGSGFTEMMNNSISQSAYYEKALPTEDVVPIANSLTSELDVLRRNMLFSGLEVISHNQKRKNFNIKVYEFGKTYQLKKSQEGGLGNYNESEHLSILVAGKNTEDNWKTDTRTTDFYDLKQSIHTILNRLGITEYKTNESEDETFTYGLQYVNNGQTLVEYGAVEPSIAQKMDADGAIFYADFNWLNCLKLAKRQKIEFAPLPKYPAVKRDLAMILDKSVSFGEIETIALKTAKKLLQSVYLFDVYEDEEKLGKGNKSYAVNFTFLDETKTLTKKEIDKLMDKLMQQFEKQLGAKQK